MASSPSYIPYLCVAAAAFITTFLMVPLVKRLAIKLDAVDYPSKRRINTKPIPRLGGTAVFLGLVVACIVQILGTWYLGWPPVLVPHPRLHISYPILALSFTVIFATGAIDDVFQLKPKQKLAGQVLAALIACVGGLRIGVIVNPFAPGEIMLGWLAYPITVIYLVAFTNIINLIDGLDGLATGICGIASFTMFSMAVLSGRIDAAALSIALFGACLAFLRYNFNPASIFLGDSGSLLLGFALGSISLLNVSRTAALTSLIIPLIVAGVPIIDTFSAIVRRKRAHISIGQADKGHIHHRLIQEGYNQSRLCCSSMPGALCFRPAPPRSTRSRCPCACSSLPCSPLARRPLPSIYICLSPCCATITTSARTRMSSSPPTTPPLSRRSRQPRNVRKSATTSSRVSCRGSAQAPPAKRAAMPRPSHMPPISRPSPTYAPPLQ